MQYIKSSPWLKQISFLAGRDIATCEAESAQTRRITILMSFFVRQRSLIQSAQSVARSVHAQRPRHNDKNRLLAHRYSHHGPVVVATDARVVAENIFVRITLSDGACGYGEAAPFPEVGGEDREPCLNALSSPAPSLISRLTLGCASAHSHAHIALSLLWGDVYRTRIPPLSRSPNKRGSLPLRRLPPRILRLTFYAVLFTSTVDNPRHPLHEPTPASYPRPPLLWRRIVYTGHARPA